ncbi:hypothetical protein TNCV_3870841 [Trichonephila clavipes]|nr:hypothetical protein TNCV_3870841 [Trichonephila clavipes]
MQQGAWPRCNRFLTVRCVTEVPTVARISTADAVRCATSVRRIRWSSLAVVPRGHCSVLKHVSPASNRDPQNRSSHILFSTSLSRNVGEVDSRKPFSPTISDSNTIRFWFPTSSTGAGTTFAIPPGTRSS